MRKLTKKMEREAMRREYARGYHTAKCGEPLLPGASRAFRTGYNDATDNKPATKGPR